MSILSAFNAAIGRGPARKSERPDRMRPGSDPSIDLADPSALSKLSGVHYPIVVAADYKYGSGHETVTDFGSETFPWYEPDDPDVIYRLFRLKT